MHIVCLGCASVFEREPSLTHVCPDCGRVMKNAVYDRLLAYAQRAADFGFQYRMLYESEYKANGSIGLRMALPSLPAIFAMAALAFISGIVGGKDEKVVDLAVQRMLATARERFGMQSERLNDPGELATFKECIAGYERRFEGLPEPVSMAVVEEMIEREYRRLALREKAVPTKERQRELARKATVKVERRQGLFPSDFKDFWNKLQVPDSEYSSTGAGPGMDGECAWKSNA